MTNRERLQALRDELVTLKIETENLITGISDLRDDFDAFLETYTEPTTPNQIRYATHRYDGNGPRPTVDFADLQDSPYWNRNQWTRGTEVYRYATTATNAEPNGWRNLLPPARVMGRVAHNLDGSVVQRSVNGDRLLNIADPSLRLDSATWLRDRCVAAGYDGIYLDEVDETCAYGYPTAIQPREFPTPALWRAAMQSYIQTLAGILHNADRKLWVNLGSSVTPWNDAIISLVDGVNSEFFIGREGVNAPVSTGTVWLTQLQLGQKVEGAGKEWHAHASTVNQQVVDYAFCSWLLATSFRGSFSASRDYGGAIVKPSPVLLTAAAKLGLPAGPFGGPNTAGTYTRNFQGGHVAVTPTSNGWSSSVIIPNT